jgi:hypothetical protein
MVSVERTRERLGPAFEPEEAWPGPSDAGDRARDPGERAEARAAILEALVQNQHAVGLAAPGSHQSGAWLQRAVGVRPLSIPGSELLGNRLELAQCGPAQATVRRS